MHILHSFRPLSNLATRIPLHFWLILIYDDDDDDDDYNDDDDYDDDDDGDGDDDDFDIKIKPAGLMGCINKIRVIAFAALRVRSLQSKLKK